MPTGNPESDLRKVPTLGLLVSEPSLSSRLRAVLARTQVDILFDRPLSDSASNSFDDLRRESPSLLFLEQPRDAGAVRQAVQVVKAASPDSLVVVISERPDPQVILDAIHAGASDCVFAPFEDAVPAAIERLWFQQRPRNAFARANRGRIIGFLSAQGGCGATTIAVHTAVMLKRESGQGTAIADLDLAAPMVALFMRAVHDRSLLDAAANIDRLDDSFWSALVAPAHGLDVLCAPPLNPRAHQPDPSQFGDVLEFMASRYPWTVVDLGRGLTPFTEALLRHIDAVYVVSTVELPAMIQARRLADRLPQTCGHSSVQLVLNRSFAPLRPSPAEIEQLTGLDVAAAIRDAGERMREAVFARTLLLDGGGFGSDIASFARRLAGLPLSSGKDKAATPAQRLNTIRATICGMLRRPGSRSRGQASKAETAWRVAWQAADTEIRLERFTEAFTHLQRAVDSASAFGDSDERFGRSLARLGGVQSRLGRTAEAIRSLKFGAAVLERALGRSHPAAAEAACSLAEVHASAANYTDARCLFQRVIDLGGAALEPKHLLIARALQGLGDVHMSLGEPVPALFAYRRALGIREEILGAGDWDVAVTLEKIADLYCAQSRFNEAEPLLWRSVMIRRAILGESAPSLAASYRKLGNYYAAQRKFTEAEQPLRYSVALACGGEVESLVASLRNLADLYENTARFAAADKIRMLAQSITTGMPGSRKAITREFDAKTGHAPLPAPAILSLSTTATLAV